MRVRKTLVAFAGSRTRVYCLEGNYPNRWTTNACCHYIFCIGKNNFYVGASILGTDKQHITCGPTM